MDKRTRVGFILAAVFLYCISTGVSYIVFSQGSTAVPIPVDEDQEHFVIDPSLPKTEECPLNGKKFTKQERDIWETRRPLAIMINNHVEARPQSGVSYADIVYEAVAEGGITRFMGVFYCGGAAYNIGVAPVRSARTYFLDWVSEYDALYNHVGGAGKCNDPNVDERAKALCQIGEYGIKDLDQFSIPFPSCYRDPDRLNHEVAVEHQMICKTKKLYDIAKSRQWTNVDEEGIAWDKNFVEWKFQDDEKEGNRGNVSTVSFVHWDGYEDSFGIKWEYDPVGNVYKRFTGGKAHIDHETDKQLTAKNIVVQFTTEVELGDLEMHLLYGTIGNGKALIFQNGQVIKGTWSKKTRTARTKFFDEDGKEVKFVRGEIWIEVVSNAVDVDY